MFLAVAVKPTLQAQKLIDDHSLKIRCQLERFDIHNSRCIEEKRLTDRSMASSILIYYSTTGTSQKLIKQIKQLRIKVIVKFHHCCFHFKRVSLVQVNRWFGRGKLFPWISSHSTSALSQSSVLFDEFNSLFAGPLAIKPYSLRTLCSCQRVNF